MWNSGNFSVVKRCTNKETGVDYALKVIDKKMVEGKEEMIETEVAILRKVHHKNVVSLVEAFDTPDKLYLVMDLYAFIFTFSFTFIHFIIYIIYYIIF